MGWASARGPAAPPRAPPRASVRALTRARSAASPGVPLLLLGVLAGGGLCLPPPAPPAAGPGSPGPPLQSDVAAGPAMPQAMPQAMPAEPAAQALPLAAPDADAAVNGNTLYIAVALAGAQDPGMARTVQRALANMTKEVLHVAGNVSVAPLLLSVPGAGGGVGDAAASGTVIERLCGLVAGRRVAALLVVGGGPAALGAALAGVSAKIPVLWLRGGGRFSTGFGYQELSPIEVRLEPGARQMVDALRALLVATHWHSFTVMADEAASASVLLRADLAAMLRAPPLHPTFVHLRSSAAPHAIFSRLADVSRLTRGVVVLMCDERTARGILAEGRRLNMVDGHFVWLWLDTRAQHDDPLPPPPPPASAALLAGDNNLEDNDDVEAAVAAAAASRRPRGVAAAAAAAAAAPPAQQPSERRRQSSDPDGLLADLPKGSVRGQRGQRQWQHTPRGSQAPPPPIMRHRGHAWAGVGAVAAEPPPFPLGMLTVRRQAARLDRHAVKAGLRVVVEALRRLAVQPAQPAQPGAANCWGPGPWPHPPPGPARAAGAQRHFSHLMAKELKLAASQALAGRADWLEERAAKALASSFQVLNLVRQPGQPGPVLQQATHQTDEVVDAVDEEGETVPGMWRGVGRVLGRVVDLDTIVWPGGDLVVPGLSARARSVFRIVTALAPPFVMEAELDEDGQCLRGLPCHRLLTRGKDNLTLVFSELETQERLEEEADDTMPMDVVDVADYPQDAPLPPRSTEATEGGGAGGAPPASQDSWPGSGAAGSADTGDGRRHDANTRFFMDRAGTEEQFDLPRYRYRTNCCYGLAMDLLENVAQELEFDFHLYVVSDGVFGSQVHDSHHHHHHSYPTPHQQHQQQQQELHQQQRSVLPQSQNIGDQTVHQLEQRAQPAQPAQPQQRHNKYSDDHRGGPRQRVDRQAPSGASAPRHTKWNGVVGDLASGAAHMSFAALSVSSARSEVMDFSVPFFYSGVSFLAAPTQKSEIPLHAFLLPFSPELWIAIFLSLNLTALAVAVYEWLSPFGLNPWGRQRSKNFSIASALWVMWGLLCGHLVAFKAPKSWPNKFLINVWGGFSVLFVASYTANIAALIAGLFFHNSVSNYHDRSLLSQRVGAPRHSAADYYVHRANPHLWEHMQRYSVATVEEGVHRLRNGTLDILIADTPILDYYRATDHGCKLQKIGDAINEDTYAVGMTKGFPLKDSVSAVIAKYTNNGYMDILQEKWYGGLPCFKLANEMAQPRPLGVAAVAGVFILLGLGMAVGILILVVEHLFYRYTLPILRHKPKGTIWKSRNIMFFSQKLYRFINCVELVSPHHAARELVHTLRQGQITSLFQKSVKRKEHEQRRRRKSKAQFFEMIQEIRRVQQEESAQGSALGGEDGADLSPGDGPLRHDGQRRRSKSPCASRLDIARRLSRELFSRSPKGEPKEGKDRDKDKDRDRDEGGSRSSLSVRRFSSEAALSPRLLGAAVGRRLSKGSTSPPDLNSRRASHLDVISGRQGLNPLASSSGSSGTSRSASRLFNGRNSGGGAVGLGVAGLAGGGMGAAGPPGPVVVAVAEPAAAAPVQDAGGDTLLEETEEDEEICRVTLDAAAAAVASRRQSGKGGSLHGGQGGSRSRTAPAAAQAADPATLRRLSRDELLLLSRCSESELRDHLQRALRDKDLKDTEVADPP